MDFARNLIRSGVRGVVVIAMTCATAAMMLTSTNVPGEWWGLYGVAIAFLFAKNGQ